ncbi:MAG: GAF domain-containing protein [Deltaproteobacteria bacterium]
MEHSPPFGEADLTNCERELIHLAGSIQPHGVLLNVEPDTFRIVQVSANVDVILGRRVETLIGADLGVLGGDALERIRAIDFDNDQPVGLQCHIDVEGVPRHFEGAAHHVGGWLVVELEATDPERAVVPPAGVDQDVLVEVLDKAVERIGSTTTIPRLANTVVEVIRELTGYDRVMLYRFDPDGHGKVIGEDRDPRLDSFLGHQYPASDIPQRARQLYLRNRLRLLADVDYQLSPLVPRELPDGSSDLDMSMCYLRSMSPLHLQYLQNMGVTATLVVSIVRDGDLWGLIACHHYSTRNLRASVRAAADLLGEVVSTRLTAIESYAHARVGIQVRRLEQRLVEATSTDGDWRLALFRNPRTLLDPVDATGAALAYDGELMSGGVVPSTPELRALVQWIEATQGEGVFACSSIEQENPDLKALTPTASGVLAVGLSTERPDYLLWFRREQLHNATWAGDPSKPMIGDNPLELSPRRSFEAWSQLVRGTAVLWSPAEIALARAFGASLVDIIAQVDAVQFLIAEHQFEQAKAQAARAKGALLIVGKELKVRHATTGFTELCGREVPDAVRQIIDEVARTRSGWRGRTKIPRAGADPVSVAVRAEVVPDSAGRPLGYFIVLTDLTALDESDSARRALEETLLDPDGENGVDAVVSAIQANASLAAMDIADGHVRLTEAQTLREVHASTRRATRLYERIRSMREDR